MKILIIAEHDQQRLKPSTLHTLQAATQLGNDIDLLIAGFSCQEAVLDASSLPHVKNIIVADDKAYEHQLAENMAELIASLAKNYQYVLTGATTFGKNILPRAAALLDVAMMSDVVKIVSANTFVRPMYAGNVLATVESHEPIHFLTIRTTAFPAMKVEEKNTVPIQKQIEVFTNTLSQFESQQLTVSTRPELTSARVIVSGGRGLKSAENFHLLEELADLLGGAVGASRAAVDAGFAPNDYQIGQTGKVVAPDLYIAVGISGAIQHLAGMKDSKVIVAINNDPDAAIFQTADYVLVGDLFNVLPELKNELVKQSVVSS